jgi:hypothetical protein
MRRRPTSLGPAWHSRRPHQRPLRYWNMARQRYCHRLLRYRNTLRVSADLAATAAALTRAESRGSPRPRAAWSERQTLRWRELDSNLRFRARAGSILPVKFVADSLLEGTGFEPSVPLTEARDILVLVARFKQTVRKRGFGVLPTISIGTGALIARSEPRPSG